jgi:hypothetical protein
MFGRCGEARRGPRTRNERPDRRLPKVWGANGWTHRSSPCRAGRSRRAIKRMARRPISAARHRPIADAPGQVTDLTRHVVERCRAARRRSQPDRRPALTPVHCGEGRALMTRPFGPRKVRSSLALPLIVQPFGNGPPTEGPSPKEIHAPSTATRVMASSGQAVTQRPHSWH